MFSKIETQDVPFGTKSSDKMSQIFIPKAIKKIDLQSSDSTSSSFSLCEKYSVPSRDLEVDIANFIQLTSESQALNSHPLSVMVTSVGTKFSEFDKSFMSRINTSNEMCDIDKQPFSFKITLIHPKSEGPRSFITPKSCSSCQNFKVGDSITIGQLSPPRSQALRGRQSRSRLEKCKSFTPYICSNMSFIPYRNSTINGFENFPKFERPRSQTPDNLSDNVAEIRNLNEESDSLFVYDF